MIMQSTLGAARSVPAHPSETRHERRLFGRARFGKPRTLDALAEQGRYFLAHRDAVRKAEAAAATAIAGNSNRQARRQMHQDAQLGGSAAQLPATAWRMFRRCFRDLPPFELRKSILTVPWSCALEVLARFPGRAFLQPDGIQVWHRWPWRPDLIGPLCCASARACVPGTATCAGTTAQVQEAWRLHKAQAAAKGPPVVLRCMQLNPAHPQLHSTSCALPPYA